MRTLEQRLRYDNLELVSNRTLKTPANVSNTVIKPVIAGFGQVCRDVLRWFNTSHEPQVWKTTARSGETFWNVYDPVNNERLVLSSEEEVRIWLDTRYNR